jgi:hypothetical protein
MAGGVHRTLSGASTKVFACWIPIQTVDALHVKSALNVQANARDHSR